MPFKRKIKVRALLLATETEFVIYGDDECMKPDAIMRKINRAELWESEGDGEQATRIVEFEIEIEADVIPIISVHPTAA